VFWRGVFAFGGVVVIDVGVNLMEKCERNGVRRKA
jgi:hypothetical protein